MNPIVESAYIEDGFLIIKGKAKPKKIKNSKLKLVICSESDNKFYLEYELNINKESFKFKKNIETILKKYSLKYQEQLDIYIDNCNYRENLYIDIEKISDDEYTLRNKPCKVELSCSNDSRLVLNISSNKFKINSILQDIKFENGNIDLTVNISSDFEEYLGNYRKAILLKDRDSKKEYYFEVEEIDKLTYRCYISNYTLGEIYLREENTLDVYIMITNNIDAFDIPVNIDIKKTIEFKYEALEKNSYFKFKPYKTGYNTLGVFVRLSNINCIVEHFSIDDGKITIDGKIDSKEFNVWSLKDNKASIVLKKRKKVNGKYQYKKNKVFNCYLEEELISVEFLNTYFNTYNEVSILDKLILNNKTEDEIWDVFIRVENRKHITHDIVLNLEDSSLDNMIIFKGHKVRHFVNKFNGGLSLYIYKKINN